MTMNLLAQPNNLGGSCVRAHELKQRVPFSTLKPSPTTKP